MEAAMKPPDTFKRMTDLGKHFGVSSHKIGRWLTDIGLRENGSPSHSAFAGGYVKSAPNGRNDGYFWVWHHAKTVAALEQTGHRQIDQPILPDRLVGPFESRANGGDGYEIIGGDGATVAWVRGELGATKIKNLLNLAHRHDVL
jgi:hypothetical protein